MGNCSVCGSRNKILRHFVFAKWKPADSYHSEVTAAFYVVLDGRRLHEVGVLAGLFRDAIDATFCLLEH